MRTVLTLLLLAAVACAQRRERSFGLVRDVDGGPWSGAKVHLVHRASPFVEDPALVDEVEVVTDERGVFVTELLLGMPYTVWAEAPSGEHGEAVRCTAAVECVPGEPLVLQEEPELRHVRRVRFEPAPGWRELGGLFCEIECEVGGVTLRRRLDAVGEAVATVASWPGARQTVRLVRSEVVLSSAVLETTHAAIEQAAAQTAEGLPEDPAARRAAVAARIADVRVIEVAAPRTATMHVVDAGGQPVVGGRLFDPSRSRERPVAISDDAGALRVVFPESGAVESRYSLLADTIAECKVGGNLFENGERATARDGEVLDVGAAHVATGRLTAAGEPVDGVALLLEGSMRISASSTWFSSPPRVLRTGEQGAFGVPGRSDAFRWRLSAVLSPALRDRFAPDEGTPLWPVALLVPESRTTGPALGDLTLEGLAPLQVQVLAADGSPPGSVELLLAVARPGGGKYPHAPILLRTDRHGRVAILLPRNESFAVVAMSSRGSSSGVGFAGNEVLELRLDPGNVVRVEVVDSGGKPVAGANVSARLAGEGDAKLAPFLGSLRAAYSVHAMPLARGETDENGRADLVVPLLPCGYFVSVRGGAGQGNSNQTFEVEPDGERLHISLPGGR